VRRLNEPSATSHNARLAVFIVGPTCSGKSEAGSHLARQGFTWIEPSKCLKDKVPLDIPVLERLQMVERVFEQAGKDCVAKWLLSEIVGGDKQSPFVITGCRQKIEVECLRPQLATLVIAVHSEDAIRFQRCSNRARPDLAIDYETFIRATAWEYSIGLAELILEADDLIVNNGSMLDFHHAIERSASIARRP
jgi:dephospho-CoA kinase